MKKRIRIIKILWTAVLMPALILGACGKAGPAQESSTSAGGTSVPETLLPVITAPAASSGSESSGQTAHPEESSTGSEQPAVTAEPVPAETELVLATLNIKHGAEGLDRVAAAIREISPDIVGLQEVDVNCERSGYADEPAELARLAGYPYYAFAKAIPLGSGEYGTAILSRFPIESFEEIALESGGGEDRALGHAVVYAGGVRLDVFVTHLSFEDRSVRIRQMKFIAGMLKQCSRYVILADLNSFVIEDISYLDAAYCVNRPDRRYGTFRRFGSSPDNIVVSEGFTELSSGVSDAECSDHSLLYARFRLAGE